MAPSIGLVLEFFNVTFAESTPAEGPFGAEFMEAPLVASAAAACFLLERRLRWLFGLVRVPGLLISLILEFRDPSDMLPASSCLALVAFSLPAAKISSSADVASSFRASC
jgi:hypothetical protein